MSYYWGYYKDETEHWEACDSIEDCIKEANKWRTSEKHAYYGTLETHVPYISPEDIIERLQEVADDEYGRDLVGDWLEDVEDKDIETLGERINDVLNQWLKETGNNPTFGNIADIKKFDL